MRLGEPPLTGPGSPESWRDLTCCMETGASLAPRERTRVRRWHRNEVVNPQAFRTPILSLATLSESCRRETPTYHPGCLSCRHYPLHRAGPWIPHAQHLVSPGESCPKLHLLPIQILRDVLYNSSFYPLRSPFPETCSLSLYPCTPERWE